MADAKMDQVGIALGGTIQWGSELAADIAGSGAAARPYDPVSWVRYASVTEPHPFPTDFLDQVVANRRAGSARAPLTIQNQVGVAVPYRPHSGTRKTGFTIDPGFQTYAAMRPNTALNPLAIQTYHGQDTSLSGPGLVFNSTLR